MKTSPVYLFLLLLFSFSFQFCQKDTPSSNPSYTVTLNYNGKDTAASTLTFSGSALTLSSPSRSGYTFNGWFDAQTGGAKITSPYSPSTNITLYAQWTANTNTISFNANTGSAVPNQSVSTGNKVTTPTPPTKPVYNFVGWYSDAALTTLYDFNALVSSSFTLYAKWEFIPPTMIDVAGGTFTMGCTSEQTAYCNSTESPTHSVTLSNFKIGKYEVTQAQWQAIMGSNPSYNKACGDNCPVDSVSYTEIQAFLAGLNQLTGKNYRLPTEAEWEYAARGGALSTQSVLPGAALADSSNIAWTISNSDGTSHPVGLKTPNQLGIYDMAGNLYEWTNDWYDAYSSSAATNPTGPANPIPNNNGYDPFRVVRGGDYLHTAVTRSRVSARSGAPYSIKYRGFGFRLAL